MATDTESSPVSGPTSPDSPSTPPDRIWFLDTLRYILVLAVVVLHAVESQVTFDIQWAVDDPRITSLADQILARYATDHGVQAVSLDETAQRLLAAYPWPGNVRELKNLCERLTLLLPGRRLGVANLPPEYRASVQPARRLVSLPNDGLDLTELEKDLIAQALERTGGNRSRAARLLGLTRDTLLYRLKKFAMR